MNNDLISRSALLKKTGWVNLYEKDKSAKVVLVRDICNAPAVDAVPVVRCKDCDWYREDESICVNPHCTKSYYGCRVPQKHFCSYGERREDG